MGIYIKGFKKPTYCMECPLTFDYDCMIQHEQRDSLIDQYKHCPIVEVKTPHGDLIDADRLRKEQNIWIGDGIAPTDSLFVNTVNRAWRVDIYMRGVSYRRMENTMRKEQTMNDLIKRADATETFAELYDIFDDCPNIVKELHKVYDKILNMRGFACGIWQERVRQGG